MRLLFSWKDLIFEAFNNILSIECTHFIQRREFITSTELANTKPHLPRITKKTHLVSLICPVNTAETHFFTEQLAKYDLIFYWNNGQFQFWGVVLVLFLGFSWFSGCWGFFLKLASIRAIGAALTWRLSNESLLILSPRV